GPYEFILGEEEGVGRYQMCSLFSPVFEFAAHATAGATADAVMAPLLCPEHRDTVSTCESEIERRWAVGSEREADDEEEQPLDEERAPLRQRLQQPLSRRDLLRGKFNHGMDLEQ
ncbi:MAG: [NiFe]-hydrogenase assembly chaperone HybE, partial [Candidatus Thiodiazotropha sp.]